MISNKPETKRARFCPDKELLHIARDDDIFYYFLKWFLEPTWYKVSWVMGIKVNAKIETLNLQVSDIELKTIVMVWS